MRSRKALTWLGCWVKIDLQLRHAVSSQCGDLSSFSHVFLRTSVCREDSQEAHKVGVLALTPVNKAATTSALAWFLHGPHHCHSVPHTFLLHFSSSCRCPHLPPQPSSWLTTSFHLLESLWPQIVSVLEKATFSLLPPSVCWVSQLQGSAARREAFPDGNWLGPLQAHVFLLWPSLLPCAPLWVEQHLADDQGSLTQQVKKSKQVCEDQFVSRQPPFVEGEAPSLRHLT